MRRAIRVIPIKGMIKIVLKIIFSAACVFKDLLDPYVISIFRFKLTSSIQYFLSFIKTTKVSQKGATKMQGFNVIRQQNS